MNEGGQIEYLNAIGLGFGAVVFHEVIQVGIDSLYGMSEYRIGEALSHGGSRFRSIRIDGDERHLLGQGFAFEAGGDDHRGSTFGFRIARADFDGGLRYSDSIRSGHFFDRLVDEEGGR